MLSENLRRRHLSPGQQAAIVASTQNWERAQSVGKVTKCGNVAALDGAAQNPATLPLDRVADRAALSGASNRTQRTADKVARENLELAAQVGR